MKWSLTPVRRKLLRTLHTGAGAFGERTSFLVSVEHEGLTGWGEATPLPELGGETSVECAAQLSVAMAGISTLRSDTDALLSNVSAPAARFALEQALMDLLAQRKGVPLREWLREHAASSVAVNAVVDSAEDAERCLQQGFRTLKLKVGARADDVQRVREVMTVAGREVSIRIDANGAWSYAAAADALSQLPGLELCEQPVRESVDLARLAERGLCPIAVDEGLKDWLRLEERGRPRVIAVLKPALVGGLRRCLAIAEAGFDCFVTCGFEGPIGRAGAAHLAAALPRQTHAHGLAMGRFFDDPPSRLDPVCGSIFLGDQPGLGA